MGVVVRLVEMIEKVTAACGIVIRPVCSVVQLWHPKLWLAFHLSQFFCRGRYFQLYAMLDSISMPSRVVCPSVCLSIPPSVTFVHSLNFRSAVAVKPRLCRRLRTLHHCDHAAAQAAPAAVPWRYGSRDHAHSRWTAMPRVKEVDRNLTDAVWP